MKEFFWKNKWSILCCGVFLLLAISGITFGIFMYVKQPAEKEKTQASIAFDNVEEEIIEEEYLFVDVKGAVKKPGVYQIKNGGRINDAIKQAGGFKSTAYTNNINLSRSLTNEMVIYIYTKSEYNKKITPVKNEKIIDEKKYQDCESSTYEIDNCLSNNQSVILPSDKDTNFTTPSTSPTDTTEKKLVNINTASIDELMTISGIGEQKAKAIISYREEKSQFAKIEDIQNVSGIGSSIYEKIKAFITV